MRSLIAAYHITIAIVVLCLLFVMVFGILFVLLQGLAEYFWSFDLMAWIEALIGIDLSRLLP